MKIKSEGYFPFVVTAESKVSKSGNNYLSIGVGCSSKNQNGEYSTDWINLIDKRDLLGLASACENTYHKICDEEAKEYKSKKTNNQTNTETAVSNEDTDSIPF